MRLPAKVKVGSQTYRVEERSEQSDGSLNTMAHAYTLVESNLIVIHKNLPVDRKRTLIVHELLHALVYTFGETNNKGAGNDTYDDWEHHFIYLLQEPLVMLLRDNPDLAAYLLDDEA